MQNTLAGFRRAVALGVPAIELDVQLIPDLHATARTATPNRNVSAASRPYFGPYFSMAP